MAEAIRRMGMSKQTFTAGDKVHGGLGVDEPRRAEQIDDENRKLRQFVADLSLDKPILALLRLAGRR